MMRWKKYSDSGLLLLACLLYLAVPSLALAQNDKQQSFYDEALAEQFARAEPVIINGEELFKVIGIRAYSAKRRARLLTQRIEAIAADPAIDPETIAVRDDENHSEIFQGDISIARIFEIDAQYQGLDNRLSTAETLALLIQEGIRDYRLERTPDRMRKNIIQAVTRSAGLVATLLFVMWLFRITDRWLERFFKRRIKKLEAKSMRVVQAEQVWKVVSAFLQLIKAIIYLGITYFFVNFVLTLFPWTRYIAKQLLHLVIDPLQSMALGFINYLPSLFFLVILYLVIRYLLKVMHGFFGAISLGNIPLHSFEPEWAWPTYRIVRLIVIVFALVIAYPYIPGSNSEAFKGISLFLGVLLSLGSTSVISNIIAGYTMTYRRAFRVGDRIRIGDTVGDVLESRLLVTTLRSLKNENIVMPNSTILNSEVTNYSTLVKENGLILHTSVGIGYEVPWRQVEAMLIEAASRVPGLAKEPAPFVLQTALTDFAVTYELNAYCNDETRMAQFYSELHRSIQDAFNENGVQIMTPNYVADTDEPKMVPVEQWYSPPAQKPDPEQA